MPLKSAIKQTLRSLGYKIEKVNPLEESIPADYNHSSFVPHIYRGAKGMMGRFLYFLAAFYLRHSSIEKGRYRLLTFARAIGRESGHEFGWRRLRTKHGFLMNLNLKDWIPQDIFLTGEFESATTAVLKKLLKPGDIAVDVGANIGYFSLLFSQCVGSSGRVFSYEPVPRLASILRNNAELNGFDQITLSSLALSDHDGRALFHVGPEDNSGLSSLRLPRGSIATLDVELARFDKIFNDANDIALVKIDVEGAELAVLRGMEGYLCNRRPYLLVEVTDKFLKEMGDDEQGLLAFMLGFGYFCYVIGDARIDLLQTQQEHLPHQWNALFSPTKIFGEGMALH